MHVVFSETDARGHGTCRCEIIGDELVASRRAGGGKINPAARWCASIERAKLHRLQHRQRRRKNEAFLSVVRIETARMVVKNRFHVEASVIAGGRGDRKRIHAMDVQRENEKPRHIGVTDAKPRRRPLDRATRGEPDGHLLNVMHELRVGDRFVVVVNSRRIRGAGRDRRNFRIDHLAIAPRAERFTQTRST